MSNAEPFFELHWPQDAYRIAPLPGGARVRALTDITLPDVAEPTLHRIPFGNEGECTVLLLPDPAKLTFTPTQTVPFGEAHGILSNVLGAAVQARATFTPIASNYDAFLAANFDASGPGDRRVLIPWIAVEARIGADHVALDASTVMAFTASEHHLEWLHRVRGIDIIATLRLGQRNDIGFTLECRSAVANDVHFHVRPMVDDRSFHHVTKAFEGAEQSFPARVQVHADGFTFDLQPQPLELRADSPFVHEPRWQYCVPLSHSRARGLDSQTDVFSPGHFVWQPHTPFRLRTHAGGQTLFVAGNTSPRTLPQHMESALDLYLVDRSGERTVIAGYPWFLDWGRDSLIFVRGLIASGRTAEAASILRRFASFEENGTLPNLLRGSEVTNRETSDAPLWLVVAVGELLLADGEANTDCGGRTLLEVARAIVEAHLAGPRFHAATGLLFSHAHHTWMDTDSPPCTPRAGYPIEIQALWQRALHVTAHHALAERVAHSIDTLFWREADGFFADCLHGPDMIADDHLRPNQWLAITLGAVTDKAKALRALRTSQCLLVPGGARSLAPRRVAHALDIGFGTDPHAPYWPRYTGPEDATRKPAYHNGTAWGWQYPLFAEALAKADPDRLSDARRLLSASHVLLHGGCVGQLPEIMDGDAPHTPRGCGAQAWSVSEWVRVWRELGQIVGDARE